MLSRMITRLLFRTVLSLGLLLGVVSYAHHLSGGDPGALWKKVAGKMLGGASDSLADLRDTVAAPVAAFSAMAGPGDGAGHEPGVGERRESVWTWRDANGITHYATERPVGIEAGIVTVDPDTNVLAPVAGRSTDPSNGRSEGRSDELSGDPLRDGDAGMPLPGVAGAVLRARGDAPAPDPRQAERVLRMLQSSAR